MFVRRRVGIDLLVAAALFLGHVPIPAVAPTPPLPVHKGKIASIKVGEVREFHASLPDAYLASGEKYPVLLMLDGEFNFTSGVIGGLHHAAQLGEMPEFIIVGIANTDRAKDCFPEELTYHDGSKAGGQADRIGRKIKQTISAHVVIKCK